MASNSKYGVSDIKVLKIEDQEDGSAVVEFECSKEAYELIFNSVFFF
jgi:hypothetical protein